MYIELEIESPLARNTKQFNNETTWSGFCDTLEQITGIERALQVVKWTNVGGETKNVTRNDMTATLSETGVTDNCHVLVECSTDESIVSQLQHSKQEDVKEFQLDKESYEQRTNSVLQWKKQLGVTDDVIRCTFKVGDRGQVPGKGQCTVAFVGKVEELEGRVFLGVVWDAPVGKNDGSIHGKRYFSCEEGRGSFLPPNRVQMMEERQTLDEI